jgi:hypothetical protein
LRGDQPGSWLEGGHLPCLVQRLGGYESAGQLSRQAGGRTGHAGSRASHAGDQTGHTLLQRSRFPPRTRAFETRASAHFPFVRRDFPSVAMTSHPLRCYKSPQKRQNFDPMNGKSSQWMGSGRQWMIGGGRHGESGPGPTWTRAARRIRAPGPDRAEHQARTDPDTKPRPNQTPSPDRTRHQAQTEPDTKPRPNRTPSPDRTGHRARTD